MTTDTARRAALTALAATPLAAGVAVAQVRRGTPLPPVTIYHLEGRRSQRIVWLMEELGFPYELKFVPGDLQKSMNLIRAFSPIVPMAPTVKYGDQVLVESGAIIELILQRHAPGRLAPPLESRDYPAHLMWMHYAEGSLAARLFSDYRAWREKPPTARSPLVDSQAAVEFAEDFLRSHPWFGGPSFSGADIMMLFPLNVATMLNLVDAAAFPKVAEWKTRIEARPAYQRAQAKALPNGMVGSLPALPAHAPPTPRAAVKPAG